MSSNFYECVKTGCCAKIANRYAYGDLHRLGSGYILKTVRWSYKPEDLPAHVAKFHAGFDTWHAWWGDEGDGDRFDYILLQEPDWFDYAGKELPTNSC